MSTLAWIVSSGILMSAIALIGSVTLFLKEATLQRIILPLVAFAAGSLIGGAVEAGTPSRSLRISTGRVHDALQIQVPAVRLGRRDDTGASASAGHPRVSRVRQRGDRVRPGAHLRDGVRQGRALRMRRSRIRLQLRAPDR